METIEEKGPAIASKSRARSVLRTAIAPLGVLLAVFATPASHAALVLSPGDAIVGGQLVGTNFNVGNTGGGGNTWPNNEAPRFAIDGTVAKYLNFAGYNTGFMVTPLFDGGAGSVISSMQIWTANDSPDRDPLTYQIWGTNAGLAPTPGPGTAINTSSFTMVASGSLALPGGRNLTGLSTENSQTLAFANTASYTQYIVVFPTLKGAPGSLMQIGEIQFSGVRSSDVLTWTGATNSVWDLGVASNWVTAANLASTYHDETALTFGDAPTNRSITIQNGGAAVRPASMTFIHNSGTYTFGGDAIQSTGTLSLVGTAEVILNTLANFTTGTVVNAGTLTVTATASLGNGPVTINSQSPGGGLTSKVTLNSPHSIGSLAGTVTPTNAVSLVLGGTLTVNQTNTADFQGIISGTGGLIKEGSSTLNLTAPNTYQGPTVINGGILQSSRPNDEPFSALPAGQPVTVNSSGTLLLGATDGLGYYEGKASSLTVNGGSVIGATNTHHTLPTLTLNGGTLTAVDGGHISSGSLINYILDGNVTTVPAGGTSYIKAAALRLRGKADEFATPSPIIFTVPRGSTAADLVVTAQIQDVNSGLVKNGNGILVLANSSTLTGPTVVQNGTLQLRNSSGLGTGEVTLQSGTVLSLAPTSSLTGFEDVSLNGGATLSGNTSVTLTDNIGSESRSVFANTPMPVTGGFTASFTYTATPGADGTAFVLQSVSPSVVGVGGGGLGYQGLANAAGLLFNIYQTSGTAFSTTGTTGGYTPTSIPLSGAPVNVTVVYDPIAGTLVETLNGGAYTQTFFGVNLQALFGNSPAFVGFTGATGGVASTQTVSNFTFTAAPQALTLQNNVTVPASATVGVEVLPSATGAPGSAVLQGAWRIGAGATVNVTGGATSTDTAYSLSATGTTSIGPGVILNVANNGTGVGELSLGDITGSAPTASLTKNGPGTLSILGLASYQGATTVNGGTLQVNGAISGSTTVNTGATLTGVGTLEQVTINAGILSPGSGLGAISTGPLTLGNGSIYNLEMNATTSDTVVVDGAIQLVGNIELAITLTADPAEVTLFTILNGNAPLLGYSTGARFSYFGTPLNQGAQFEVPGNGFSQQFTIDYTAGGGQDVVLRAVPEPASGAVLLGGLGTLLGLRRRRKTLSRA